MSTKLARLLSTRPVRSLVIVLVFIVLAGVFGGPVAEKLEAGEFSTPNSESAAASDQFSDASGVSDAVGVLAIVDGSDDRALAVAEQLSGVEGIVSAEPVATSDDGQARLVAGQVSADVESSDVGAAALAEFEDTDDVELGGSVISGTQLPEAISADLGRAELFALPLLLILSLLFFRGRATVAPVLVGTATVLGTFCVLGVINLVYSVNVFALNLVIGLGLGLSIDYTLFLITRFREELRSSTNVADAIAVTMRTAGRTVAYSAATVALALATLTVFNLSFARSMGIAGATVAVVAALTSLAITPVLMGLWGHRLQRRNIQSALAARQRWYRIAQAVMRRPGIVAAATTAVMVVVALPVLGVKWAPADSTAIPKDLSSRTVADAIQTDFAGVGAAAATVAATADQADEAEVKSVADQIGRIDNVTASVPVPAGEDLWRITVTVDGNPAGSAAQQVVRDIRSLDTDIKLAVGGPAAEFVDLQGAIGERLPVAGGLLIALTLIVLWLMTGSVVLPLKAIVMNLLTVAAALAPLVLIFQEGRLQNLLGYTSNGGVEPTNFLVTCAVVFALSTDYGVFLLERISEARTTAPSEREAVAVGVAATGRVITAAAILLAVAIGAFATSSVSFIMQIGIATATAVLIDAFVVRTFLVPSLMALLGRWNWWSPAPLRALHNRLERRNNTSDELASSDGLTLVSGKS